MRRAFTLLELLTVVAIMGILGSAAVAGYQAVTRGIAEKAALDAAYNISAVAQLRAAVDRRHTYLFLFTEVLSEDNDDEVANVAGLAVAVKGSGRISAVEGSKLFDEFGDLDQAFIGLVREDGKPLTDEDYKKSATQFRLYNLNQKDFAIVRNGIVESLDEPDLQEYSAGSGGAASGARGANTRKSADTLESRKIRVFGYEKVGGSATFKAGEECGREFAAVKLPAGYTFEKGKKDYGRNDFGLKLVSCHEFTENSGKYEPQVYSRRPDGSFTELK